MKARLTGRDRNGLIFIQAMTLWRDQEALRNMALTESHQVSMGGAKNSQNLLFVSDEDRGEQDVVSLYPCQRPRINWWWLVLQCIFFCFESGGVPRAGLTNVVQLVDVPHNIFGTLTLCRSTPLRMLASVMNPNMTRDPTIQPCAQASRMRSSEASGFSYLLRFSKPLEGAPTYIRKGKPSPDQGSGLMVMYAYTSETRGRRQHRHMTATRRQQTVAVKKAALSARREKTARGGTVTHGTSE